MRLTFEQPHDLSPADAKQRGLAACQKLRDLAGFSVSWRSDTEAEIERTGARGRIQIEPQRFLVSLELSFALQPLRHKIENWIREALQAPEVSAAAPDPEPDAAA